MGIRKIKNSHDVVQVWVDKRWPDGKRFRRIVANVTQGKHLLARINEAIVMGTWRDLRRELSRQFNSKQAAPTVADLADDYLAHCERVNRRPEFKRLTLVPIRRILGTIPVRELRRSHAYEYIEKRSKDVVMPATINRGLAVLKNMMTYAVDREWIDAHPLTRFSLLPEPEKAIRPLSFKQERTLVESVANYDLAIGAYTAVLGETGLRKSEGTRLCWHHIDAGRRMLTVEQTKSGKVRYVPLSQYALDWLAKLTRVVGVSEVFLRENRKPWRDPRGPFLKGRDDAGLEWVGIHDLRHFRATQWVKLGVDVRTVQELLGHSTILTTMRYSHFAPSHAVKSVREVERIEAEIQSSRTLFGHSG